MVRIRFPPAESPRTIGSCPTLQVRRRYPDSFPLLHGHEFGHCAVEHGSIRKLGTSSKAMIIESSAEANPAAASDLVFRCSRLPHGPYQGAQERAAIREGYSVLFVAAQGDARQEVTQRSIG
jgi:hypothetical protein